MADVVPLPLPTPAERFAANTRLAYFHANRWRRTYPDLASELVNAALTGLWHAARKYTPDRGAFGRYAGHLIRNAMKAVLKEERRRGHQLLPAVGADGEELDAAALIADHRPVPPSDMELADLLGVIPADAAALVALHVLDGYSHVAIGELLGVSSVTARARVRKGLDLLRAALGA